MEIRVFQVDYLAAHQKRLRPCTLALVGQAWTSFGAAHPDITNIEQIEPHHVEAWQLRASEHGSVTTANIYLRHLRASLNWLKRRKLLPENPCDGVKPFYTNPSRQRFLSDRELERVLWAAEQSTWKLHLYIALGALAGLRAQELAAARWDWLHDDCLYVQCDDGFRTKSGQNRTIPICSRLRQILDKTGDGFIFSQPGPTLNKSYYPRKALRRLGDSVKVVDLTPHVLRHTFGSRLVQKGVSIFKVSKWMGHSSVLVTERHYAHLAPGKDSEIDKL